MSTEEQFYEKLETKVLKFHKKNLKEIEGAIEEVGKKLLEEGRRRTKDFTKLTKKRLYAYSHLKSNIERYKADIEDTKIEKDFGKSKSIIEFRSRTTGEPPTEDEIRQARIILLERKIARDETELKELDAALNAVKDDEYYNLIDMIFIKNMKQDDVAEIAHCDKTTVWRNVGRMLDTMSIVLYGADALAEV